MNAVSLSKATMLNNNFSLKMFFFLQSDKNFSDTIHIFCSKNFQTFSLRNGRNKNFIPKMVLFYVFFQLSAHATEHTIGYILKSRLYRLIVQWSNAADVSVFSIPLLADALDDKLRCRTCWYWIAHSAAASRQITRLGIVKKLSDLMAFINEAKNVHICNGILAWPNATHEKHDTHTWLGAAHV